MMENEWIYYNLFFERIDLLDYAVEEIVKEAHYTLTQQIRVERWFFIRYLDYTGPHIRIRFLVPLADMEQGIHLLECIFQRRMERFKGKLVPPTKRLIPFQMGSLSQSVTETKYELAVYEPEFEKYGGETGTAMAETLFQYSSEITCKMMNRVIAGEINRFTLGLLYMDSVLGRMNAETSGLKDDFLHNYINYWSGTYYSNGAVQYRNQMLRSAAKRRELAGKLLKTKIEDAFIEDYAVFTENVIKELMKQNIGKERRDLLFHFTHMMNNRLGIYPVEEAYMAALLLQPNDCSQQMPG